jgi:flagellar protein FlaJ
MLEKFAVKFLGGLTEPYMEYFESLDRSLRRGMFKISAHEYVSSLIMLSLVSFIVVVIVGSIFITISITSIVTTQPMIYSYTITVIFALVASGVVFFAGYYYPNIRANSIKTQIDRGLPFSVFFMATTASSGIHPLDVFKTLSQRKGPIGREASKIFNDVHTLGMNLTDSMAKVANRTPSPSFADLLWGMISVITTGGRLDDYLNTKTRTFMSQYRRSLNDYAKKIALFTEIYITLVMVGSLFFIVLTAIMSPLGGMDILMLQTFVVFIMTPLVSMGFIVILKGSSPME